MTTVVQPKPQHTSVRTQRTSLLSLLLLSL